MLAKNFADYSAYLGVRLAICFVQALPLSACPRLSRRMAWLAWHVLKLRRKIIRENLSIAFPEKSLAERDEIAQAMWQHLFLMVMEIMQARRKVHRTNWRDFCPIDSLKPVIRLLASGRPMVIISGHLGNFELGGYLLGLHGFPTSTVARTLDNAYLDRFVNDFRGETGQTMLPKHGSGSQIASLLKSGGTLVLLGDQHAGESGCWVDFFGKPASTHKAVAVFTLGSLAPTLVASSLRDGQPLRLRMEIAAVVDPEDKDFQLGSIPLLTEWYTRHLEEMIRKVPEQYWWVHRRWKGNPEDRRNRRRNRRLAKAA